MCVKSYLYYVEEVKRLRDEIENLKEDIIELKRMTVLHCYTRSCKRNLRCECTMKETEINNGECKYFCKRE